MELNGWKGRNDIEENMYMQNKVKREKEEEDREGKGYGWNEMEWMKGQKRH